MEFVERLDESGKAAWITVMVLGFIFFWPIGLAVLFYLIWSGRMGQWKHNGCYSWQSGDIWGGGSRQASNGEESRGKGRRGRRHHRRRHHRQRNSSGNTAFDSYREETLRRLEEEQGEFEDFLDRLRQAKDKDEFDQFMTERKAEPETPPEESSAQV